MRLVVFLAFFVTWSAAAYADSFNVTVDFTALAAGLEEGRTHVDYEVADDVWRELQSFGVTPSLLIFAHRPADNSRNFVYALPLKRRAGRLTAPAIDWSAMDAYELEIGGWNKNYYVNLMRVGDGDAVRSLRWELRPPATTDAPRPVTVDPRVVALCHEEFSYIDPGFVQRCADLFVGVECEGALASIRVCKSTQARIGPGAIEDCLRRATGR